MTELVKQNAVAIIGLLVAGAIGWLVIGRLDSLESAVNEARKETAEVKTTMAVANVENANAVALVTQSQEEIVARLNADSDVGRQIVSLLGTDETRSLLSVLGTNQDSTLADLGLLKTEVAEIFVRLDSDQESVVLYRNGLDKRLDSIEANQGEMRQQLDSIESKVDEVSLGRLKQEVIDLRDAAPIPEAIPLVDVPKLKAPDAFPDVELIEPITAMEPDKGNQGKNGDDEPPG